jgi:hypothetical protein
MSAITPKATAKADMAEPGGRNNRTPSRPGRAPSQLAIDGEIEQRQVSNLPVDLKPGSYGPDMLLPQGRSGSDHKFT